MFEDIGSFVVAVVEVTVSLDLRTKELKVLVRVLKRAMLQTCLISSFGRFLSAQDLSRSKIYFGIFGGFGVKSNMNLLTPLSSRLEVAQ
jgi:hypothetical protein